jgi:hypothetical protein
VSRSQARLQVLIEEILNENKKLKRLIYQSEDSFDARSAFTRRLDDDSIVMQHSVGDHNDDALTIRGVGRSDTVRTTTGTFEARNIRFTFESILEQSWVYRRNERNECDCSFASSVQRSHAWSIFSGYSLADISELSVIAMPLTLHEITNRKHYEVKVKGKREFEPIECHFGCAADSPNLNVSMSSESLNKTGPEASDVLHQRVFDDLETKNRKPISHSHGVGKQSEDEGIEGIDNSSPYYKGDDEGDDFDMTCSSSEDMSSISSGDSRFIDRR